MLWFSAPTSLNNDLCNDGEILEKIVKRTIVRSEAFLRSNSLGIQKERGSVGSWVTVPDLLLDNEDDDIDNDMGLVDH